MRERCITQQMDTMVVMTNLTSPAARLTGVSIYHTLFVSAAGTIGLEQAVGHHSS